MCRRATLAVVLLIALIFALSIGGNAQSTTHKIPTAAQVAVQKKPVNRKGVMRGTTNTERWAAAIKNADQRAAKLRAGHKGVK
jgi:hypothetical protein